jgi:integrase/recombinase XerD
MSSAADALPNRCWPVAEWPALDQAAWTAALQPGDPFEPGGLAANWAGVSCRMIENGYGRWLGWLDWCGLLDPKVAPEARVTMERVVAYIADLRATTSTYSVQRRLQQLGDAMRAMAPGADWRWILRAADRIRNRASSVRNKRARLQSPEQLVALGMRLMVEADAAANMAPINRAMAYRDGLMIALLAYRPIRGGNLAAITCGQQLVQRGGSWWLLFTGSETKTRRPLELSFPTELVPSLEHYLAIYRPMLLSKGERQARPPTAALWISSIGTAMVYASIAHQIGQRTAAAFGAPLSPHLFRDCAATWIAILEPEHVRIVLAILGHSSLATSERHYNQARSLEAGRRYHQTVAVLRRRTRAPGE